MSKIVLGGKRVGRRRGAGYRYHVRTRLGALAVYEDESARYPHLRWWALYWPPRFGGTGVQIGNGPTPQLAADAAAEWLRKMRRAARSAGAP